MLSTAAMVACTSAAAAPVAKPQTLVFTGSECLVTAEAPPPDSPQNIIGPILAIVAPILVELAIDAVVTDLKKVRTVKSEGSLNLNLWKRPDQGSGLLLNMPRCITVVTGEFRSGTTGERLSAVNKATAVEDDAPVATLLKRLSDNGIGATRIYHVFEAQAVTSGDNTAFNYEPVYFRSEELMPGNRASKQGLVYNVALRGPGASPWGTAYALAPISLGEVESGTRWHLRSTDEAEREKLRKLTTGALSTPGMSEHAYLAYVRDWNSRSIQEFMPANLQVEVVQTKKPSDAAVFLATVLEKAKPKITERAGAAVNPDGPFNESQASLEAEITLLEAEKALASLEAATPQDAGAINIAKLKVRKAKEKFENLQ